MPAEAWVVWLIVGGVAGWLTSEIIAGSGFGVAGNIIIGSLGAVVASYFLPHIGVYADDNSFTFFFASALGGVALLTALSLLRRIL